MGSHVLLGMIIKQKGVNVRVREVLHTGRNALSRSNIGGLKFSSQLISLSTHEHGEDGSRSSPSGGGSQAASDHAARTHLQDGSTLKEAIFKLVDCVKQGARVNSDAYNHVLQWCSKEKDLELVKQVHDSVQNSQMEQDPRVVNMLLKCYMECGRLESAQELFNTLLKKSTMTWNTMIAGCVKHDQAEGAIETYKQMRNEGGQPDATTYLSVLKACASPTALKWRKDIHAHIVSDGLQADARVANALAQMYAKTGLIADDKQVESKGVKDGRNALSRSHIGGLKSSSEFIRLTMNRHGNGRARSNPNGGRRVVASHPAARTDLQAGSTLKEAVTKLMVLVNQGTRVNSYAYNQVLQWCSKEKDLELVKQVHDSVKDNHMEQDPYVANMLLKCYMECGRLESAQELFNKLLKKSTVTWNMMIAGRVKHAQAKDAIEMYKQMRNEGGQPDAITYLSVLKACASPTALKCGKDIHAHIVRDGLQADVRVANALVQMYAKTGLIADAKQVFDNMRIRDVISWTAMIGGLAEQGLGQEAFSLFLEMQRQGIAPNAITYLSILNPSSSAGAVRWLKEVHSHALEAGLDDDVRVGNALVQMYAKTCLIVESKQVFDKMRIRDIITWNAMIGGLAEQGLGQEAFSLFLEMQREGIAPNANTYLSILNPCSSAGAAEWLKEVHTRAVEAGFVIDVRLATALVQMYVKTGLIADAKQVFDEMQIRDVISWTAMIGGLAEQGLGHEAFSLFLEMQREGITPDAITYLSILNPSSSAGAVQWLKEVHTHALEAGLGDDVRIGNALVQMYAKTGLIADAKQVFDNMRIRNVISWTAMIGGLAEQGFGHEAFSLFLEMQREGITPNAITFLSILNPASSAGAVEWLKEVHTHALDAGLDDDVRVGNALVQMFAKTGLIVESKQVFDKMRTRDIISWTVMIGALAEQGLGQEAFSLFLEMHREGIAPDKITYLSILNPCSSTGAVKWLKDLHAHAIEAGLDVDVRVATALVQMYAKTGLIADAKQVFDKMRVRNVISWTVMIGGLAQHGHGREALELFEEMESKGVKPDDLTFVAVLSACSHAGLVEEGHSQFDSMMRDYGIEPDLEHYNCVVDMLGRAGRLKEAHLFILNMPIKPDVVTWMTFLGACRTHQNVELAELAATECMELRPTEAAANVLLSNVYASLGSWDQVSSIRRMSQERGIRKDPGRCSIEVGNKVHDFLVGDTSHPETREIYNMLSRLSEKLKSEGYSPDTRLVLRDMAEEDKESAICSHSEKLAIAYGLMHLPPGEPIRVYKNLRICTDCHTATKLISKSTGREIVARDANRFHHFKYGSCSCGDYW